MSQHHRNSGRCHSNPFVQWFSLHGFSWNKNPAINSTTFQSFLLASTPPMRKSLLITLNHSDVDILPGAAATPSLISQNRMQWVPMVTVRKQKQVMLWFCCGTLFSKQENLVRKDISKRASAVAVVFLGTLICSSCLVVIFYKRGRRFTAVLSRFRMWSIPSRKIS